MLTRYSRNVCKPVPRPTEDNMPRPTQQAHQTTCFHTESTYCKMNNRNVQYVTLDIQKDVCYSGGSKRTGPAYQLRGNEPLDSSLATQRHPNPNVKPTEMFNDLPDSLCKFIYCNQCRLANQQLLQLLVGSQHVN